MLFLTFKSSILFILYRMVLITSFIKNAIVSLRPRSLLVSVFKACLFSHDKLLNRHMKITPN
jgi:hypothetical protein